MPSGSAGEFIVIAHLKISRLVKASMMAACLVMPAAGSLEAGQPPPPDNSKVNARDRKPSQVTADQQKNNEADLEITRNIRKAITDDTSLSTYAHNIKVITRGGKVTLKGPVRTADEKKAVVAMAAAVAGAENVINQVSIAPKASASKKAGN